MTKLIGTESQSSQVARIIEKDILTGKLPPDSRLRSTRSMADQFGVGQRVIVSAFDILERKDLVVRMPRKGVCVKARGQQQNTREVLFFAFGNRIENHPITQAVLGLNSFPMSRKNSDFFYRIISDTEGNQQRLDVELARLDNLGYLDCAIIFLNQFYRSQVERCLQMPYPVIFVGDPIEGDYEDLNYTRIGVDSNLLFLTAVDYAITQSYRNIRLYLPQLLMNHSNIISDLRALTDSCQKHQVKLELITVSGSTETEIIAGYQSAVRQQQTAPLPHLMLMYGIPIPPDDNLHFLAELPRPSQFDCLILDPIQPHAGLWVGRDLSDLQTKLLEELENITVPDRPCRKVTASCGYRIYSSRPLT